MKTSASLLATFLSLSLVVTAVPISRTPYQHTIAAHSSVESRSLFGLLGKAGEDLTSDAAHAAEKDASGGLLSHLKSAVVGGLESVAGSAAIGDILDHFEGNSSSTSSNSTALDSSNSTIFDTGNGTSSFDTGNSTVFDTSNSTAFDFNNGTAFDSSNRTALDTSNNTTLDPSDSTAAASEPIAGTLFDPSNKTPAFAPISATTAADALSNQTVEARSIFGSLLGKAGADVTKDASGDIEKAASGGILSHLKNAAVSGLETVAGSAVIGDLLGDFNGNSASDSSNSTGAEEDGLDNTNTTAGSTRMVRLRRSPNRITA